MAIPYEDKSFWLRQYGPYVPEPPLVGDVEADVAVVGAGFTGLSTALHLRQESPGLRVVVLEAHIVGFGASGRNGGFNMTLFGLEPAVTQALFGQARTVEAHRYMERAVDFVRDLVEFHHIESDYEHPGFLRVATTPGFVRRIQHDIEILTKMGIGGIDWWDADRVREEIHSPCVLGAWWEPRCGLLDPVKHVRELKRLALQAGAVIHEETPVTGIERGGTFSLHTPGGRVRAGRIVLATNAWSHLLGPLKRKQVPAFTHMVVTEPLRPEQLDDIGWRHRQGIEDARNLVHYLRLTADQRIAIGGSDVTIAFGGDMDHDLNPRVFADLERDLIHLFPPLAGIRFVSRWGGPVSVPIDMAPAIGFVGDRRVVYSLGCVGHGVSLSQLNGRTITDLVLEKQTDLTAVWFVGRRTIPWPPEPIRFAASHAIRGYLRAEDAWYERNAVTRE
jgi:glycine/D-amino acid oxidase-like deaminating enzyme